MGEKTHLPNKNNKNNDSDGNENNTTEQIEEPVDLDLDIEEANLSNEEFESINNQLDALSTALDDIESKNDNIQAELLQLLEANRLITKQLRECNLSAQTAETEMEQ